MAGRKNQVRWLALIALLAGCTPVNKSLQTIEGEPIEYAWVFLAPFCFFLCNTQVSTTGSKVEGSGSNTQSSSQNLSTGSSQ